MAIRPDDVERIGELARLEIAPADRDRLARELSKVLDFVAALDRLDLSAVASDEATPDDRALREDHANGRRLSSDAALEAAPARAGDFFLTPPIVENLEP
jgi:aspartyl-tRNA(Asn)/glutamyl-tRNA(Gln) amidotransferase subunit C